jgi:hypothetical protein
LAGRLRALPSPIDANPDWPDVMNRSGALTEPHRDTRTLHRVLEHASRVEGKVILVGDDAQLGAVGPGGLYAALVERLGAASLTANHRQHDLAERDALRSLRDGAADAFLAYAGSSTAPHRQPDLPWICMSDVLSGAGTLPSELAGRRGRGAMAVDRGQRLGGK